MSYRDPKQVIDTRYQSIAQGIQNFYTTINQSLESFTAYERKKNEEAEKKLSKARETSRTEYVNTQIAADEWATQMGDKEDADALQIQITNALTRLDDEMNEKIKSLGTSASQRDIDDVMIDYVGQMKQLHADVSHLAAAYQEWNEVKELNPNEERAIVASYNPEMISIFEAWDDGKRNVQLSQNEQNKKWQLSQWDLSKPKNDDGSYNIVNTINTTDWSTKADKEGRYFKHAEQVNLKSAKDDIKKLMDQGVISKEKWEQKNGKNVKTMVFDKTKYDRWKGSEYGKEFADSYINDSNAEGQWQMMGGYTTKAIDADDPRTLQGMYTSYDDDGQPVKDPTYKEYKVWKGPGGKDFSPENLREEILKRAIAPYQ